MLNSAEHVKSCIISGSGDHIAGGHILTVIPTCNIEEHTRSIILELSVITGREDAGRLN